MIFLSAQPDTLYFKWQLEVQLVNFHQLGISKNHIHILVSFNPKAGISAIFKEFSTKFADIANFYFYTDDRLNKIYQPTVRPHIIKKHFLKFPYLENEAIFYHDADIIFRSLPDFEALLNDDVWYLSDTRSYISSESIIKNAGRIVLEEMCDLLDIDQQIIEKNTENSGGAQYLLKNLTYQFWDKVEADCTKLYTHLIENETRYEQIFLEETKIENYTHIGIIPWCTDMWVVLWNGLKYNYQIKIAPQLDFCWPKDPLSRWSETHIFHNAGLDISEKFNYFYKADFQSSMPYHSSFEYVNVDSCSIKYVEAINETLKFKRVDLSDVSFLIPVRIDSPERLINLEIIINYITKQFKTNIIVLEADSISKIPNAIIDHEHVLYKFVADNRIDLHRTKYNNEMIGLSSSPFVVLYDTDVIIESTQIEEAVSMLRTGEIKAVLPYDGGVISINSLKVKDAFRKKLDIKILKNSDQKFSSTTSVGGAIFLDRETFIKAGMENEQFWKWGPEDLERVRRLKILGYVTKRIQGPIYHLFHPTEISSGYESEKEKFDMLEQYLDVVKLDKHSVEQRSSKILLEI
ncbi:glycosyltransferase family 2 protein [Sphingobacterium sp.]|uniref:glycosyltransferase family 2 protein n=1 Tax=Sphingobacterium sp. TaxID=341027 RepID=UPI002899CF9E|nr:glycosyltransferase family 2 protein [Sphingobacterium sp.]